MESKTFEAYTRLASAFVERSYAESWPVQIKLGIPYLSENGNRMIPMQVKHGKEFPFGEKLNEIVNHFMNYEKAI